jgi:hypothetical protein
LRVANLDVQDGPLQRDVAIEANDLIAARATDELRLARRFI